MTSPALTQQVKHSCIKTNPIQKSSTALARDFTWVMSYSEFKEHLTWCATWWGHRSRKPLMKGSHGVHSSTKIPLWYLSGKYQFTASEHDTLWRFCLLPWISRWQEGIRNLKTAPSQEITWYLTPHKIATCHFAHRICTDKTNES